MNQQRIDIVQTCASFNLLQIDSKITEKYEYIFKRTNTAKNIEKLNIELKNSKWDDVFIDENPDSAYDTFLKLNFRKYPAIHTHYS